MNFVNIAYYNKNDWGHLLSVVTDTHKMHNSWDDWFKDFIKTKTELTLNGFNVKDIRVNVEELVDYCKLRNIKLDGKARASFVREKE